MPAESLVECGIPRAALIRCVGKRATLTGCASLMPMALASLPPALGGTAEFIPVSPAAFTPFERAVARSSQRGASLGSQLFPTRPNHGAFP